MSDQPLTASFTLDHKDYKTRGQVIWPVYVSRGGYRTAEEYDHDVCEEQLRKLKAQDYLSQLFPPKEKP